MRFWRKRRADEHEAAPSVLTAGQALAEAEALTAGGRYGDAIELLTRANRAVRNAELELRLVDLRSEAFANADTTGERPPWPESVPDSFPGELIPEIQRSDLTSDVLHSAIHHHGSLIVRGLIDEARVEQLAHDIEASLASFDRVTDGSATPDDARWYSRFVRDTLSDREAKRSRGSVMTVESPATLFDLLEAFDASGLDDLAAEYFGERPYLLARKGTLRHIAAEGNTGGWHQDGAFMGAGIRSLNVWFTLTHCGDTAPGMDIVGRRLDEIVQTGGGAFTAWATDPDAAEAAAAGAIVRPIFEPGDGILFDHMNLHRTAIDPSMTIDRYAIETWLLSPSTYDSMSAVNDNGYSPKDQVPVVL